MMHRRNFFAVIGGAALVSGGRAPADGQAQGLPIIGFINTTSLARSRPLVDTFHRALREAGFVEGRNVHVEYRWAEGQYEKLGPLTAELIRLNPTVIVATGGTVAGKAAKAVTSRIPILFIAGFDPVHEGLVTSIGNPGGNATGVAVYTAELVTKRLELLHQLLPGRDLAMLVNPGAVSTPIEKRQALEAARRLNIKLLVLEAQTQQQIESAFAQAGGSGAGGISVSADSFFTGEHRLIVELAARHKMPACYPWRLYVDAGGLLSYGPSLHWAFGVIGSYAGQIVKGATPDKLPVQLPSKFETLVNLKAARALSIAIPTMLVADEIIE